MEITESILYEVGDKVIVNDKAKYMVKSEGWCSELLDYVDKEVIITKIRDDKSFDGESCYNFKSGDIDRYYLPQSCLDSSEPSEYRVFIKRTYLVGNKEYETKEEAQEEVNRNLLRKYIEESQDPIFFQEKTNKEDVIDYFLDNGEELLASLKKIFKK